MLDLAPQPNAVSAAQSASNRLPAHALRAKPAFVRTNHLPAVAAVFQIRRDRRLGHLASIAEPDAYVRNGWKADVSRPL